MTFSLGWEGLRLWVEETTKHEEGGAGFILEEISDQVLVPLPKLWGIDLSITKHVLMVWIAAAVLILICALGRRRGLVPRGIANFLEAVVVFLRDDVLKPYLGHDADRFAPYLLTVFFFILTMNLLGLVPMGATATSNLSVTATLAVLTFLIGQGSALIRKGPLGYLRNFVPPGIPALVVPILFVAELLGLFTKHFALAIRLFANMVADHMVVFTLLGLIFIFGKVVIAFVSVPAAAAIELLAVLIAFIQAYIFTMLSAVFIGMALAEEH
ncbi:MAG: F0F1 ATP synthase subunit A [candidate division KSB1 bacterium]|nr:F0F1 ATP synthase subunit A [candidate division KSB1 bacterium]